MGEARLLEIQECRVFHVVLWVEITLFEIQEYRVLRHR